MIAVEILYFAGCPAYRRARFRVVDALAQLKIQANVTMTLIRNLRDASDHDFHGSPTIRVEGRDIDPVGTEKNTEVGLVSRTYAWKGKKYDAPPLDMLLEFLRPLAPPP